MHTTSPEAVGLSSERLAHIQPTMQSYIDNGQLAGIATLVYRHGQIVHASNVGYRNLETKAPITDDTIYRLYTMTKPVTSIALMQLYEQGKFLLTDPVSKYIPAFDETRVFAGKEGYRMLFERQNPTLNIRHLLTHTSGLSLGIFDDSPVEDLYREHDLLNREQTYEHQMETLASLPLLFQPGTTWRYSMSTDVCGYLVEVISGMPFADYVQEHICKPLNMTDTSFVIGTDKLDRLSELYSHNEDGDLVALEAGTFRIRDYTAPTTSPSGGAGLLSSLPDYMNLCKMLINRGQFEGKQILGRKTIDYMTRNHLASEAIPFTAGENHYAGYGFGLMSPVIMDSGQTGYLSADGEYNWMTAGDTYFFISPQDDLFGLFFTQYLPIGHARRPTARDKFRTLVYQAIID